MFSLTFRGIQEAAMKLPMPLKAKNTDYGYWAMTGYIYMITKLIKSPGTVTIKAGEMFLFRRISIRFTRIVPELPG